MQPLRRRLLSVIVVYGRDLDGVLAWPFLSACLMANSDGEGANIDGYVLESVLIYDNSKEPLARPAGYLKGCSYIHDPGNGGTAAAYSRACTMAQEAGIDWLLLLDHDTLLPVGFLEAASLALSHANSRVGALVPWIYHGDSVVSPAKVSRVGTIVPLQYQNQMSLVSGLTAISSGALLYVPMLVKKLPFPNGLWLDYIDHWIFSKLYACRWQVMVFDASLQHDLSVYTVKSLSPARLTSILNGEAVFLSTLGLRARFVYPFRIALRVFRYFFVKPTLAIHMIKWIFNKIMNRQ